MLRHDFAVDELAPWRALCIRCGLVVEVEFKGTVHSGVRLATRVFSRIGRKKVRPGTIRCERAAARGGA